MKSNTELSFQKPLTRFQYLQIVNAAIVTERFRFARDIIIKWLGSYPGDLKAGRYYAKALIGMGQKQQAIKILRGLCEADPEDKATAETLLYALSPLHEDLVLDSDELTYLFVMAGKKDGLESLAPWGNPLLSARLALESGDLDEAELLMSHISDASDRHALLAVTHLRIFANKKDDSSPHCGGLAAYYHNRFPDCLACTLIYSDCLMKAGKTDLAVALIHQAAARDIGGQVISRLWGVNHPYRSLWAQRMEMKLDTPIPAVVATALGRNRLSEGYGVGKYSSEYDIAEIPERDVPKEESSSEKLGQGVLPEDKVLSGSLNNLLKEKVSSEDRMEKIEDTQPTILKPSRHKRIKPHKPQIDKELNAIAEAFDRIALKVKLPGIAHLDGRFPVYVVFSHRSQLESVYGAKMTAILDAEMWRLVEEVRRRDGWNARLFFVDDPLCTDPLGIKPVKSNDPWELKLALRDLDAALAKRGEQIGALLIVGGPNIVPFHHLPNPIQDFDGDVPSDNPYASRDNNYFLPEWPVGRLPGGDGNDARLLLDTLRRISSYHASFGEKTPWFLRIKESLKRIVEGLRRKNHQGFGYTAAIWKKAATEVFQTIGEEEDLKISPPLGVDTSKRSLSEELSQPSSSNSRVPTPNKNLAYFNLHGVIDTPDWYGHSNPLLSSDGPDFPIALRPSDLEQINERENPKFVLSEACYGSHIYGRSVDQAMSLKFLQMGSLAVVGSTVMAYASIGTPLIAADYLSYTFWRFLLQGMPVGEALRQAKIRLANHVNQLQGFLDVEDQKTLISFILFGDPLAQYSQTGRSPKVVRYLSEPLSGIATVSEGFECIVDSQPMPAEVMNAVKKVVKQYLPGMTSANLSYVRENVRKKDTRKRIPHAAQNGVVGSPDNDEKPAKDRQVITLSNEAEGSEGIHPIFARLTLDDEGDLVKLVISH